MDNMNHIKINIPEAADAADSITASVCRLQNSAEGLPALIERTSAFWTGEGADEFRRCSRSYISAVTAIIGKISERAGNIRSIIDMYRGTEFDNTRNSEDLSGDFLT